MAHFAYDHVFVDLQGRGILIQNPISLCLFHLRFSLDPLTNQLLKYRIFLLDFCERLFTAEVADLLDLLPQFDCQVFRHLVNALPFGLLVLQESRNICCSLSLVDVKAIC